MKKLVCFLLVAGSVSPAFARDSTWKMCSASTELFGDTYKLAMNFYEHRSTTGDGRQTDLALIFGNQILKGGYDSSDSDTGTVSLVEDASFYKGTAAIDYTADTLTLQGTLNLQGEETPVNAVLTCEDYSD